MEKQISLSLEAGEVIYKIDTVSDEAYIITEGEVELYSREGFLLATLTEGEMFGETSLIMGEKRSVTAKAGSKGIKATIIPKRNLVNITQKDPILAALWKKTQLRLIESNNKNSELFIEVETINEELEHYILEQEKSGRNSEKLTNIISRIKQLLYPSKG